MVRALRKRKKAMFRKKVKTHFKESLHFLTTQASHLGPPKEVEHSQKQLFLPHPPNLPKHEAHPCE